MPLDSAFYRRFSTYRSTLDKLDKNASIRTGKYLDFLNSIAALNDKITELNAPGAEGAAAAPLNDAQIGNLREQYQTAINSANAYLGQRGKSTLKSRHGFIVGELLTLMNRDLDVLGSVKANQRLTLEEVFSHSRSLCLDVTGSHIKTAGGALSIRMPIAYEADDGQIKKGFFTKGSKIQKTDDVIMKYAAKYGQYADMWKAMRKMDEFSLYKGLTKNALFAANEFDPFINEDVPDEWRTSKELKDILKNFKKDFSSAFIYKDAVMGKPGTSIEDRNCAMSSVAGLLGVNHLLANSKKATLIKDGIAMQGCFMEQAAGSDMNHLHKDDPMTIWASGKGWPKITPDALKQMADLQILDYLCGNIDRHRANLLYHFDAVSDGKPVLTGITGIDNDGSFGMFEPTTDQKNMSEVPIEFMKVISRSMADKIRSLSPDMLDITLQGYHLSADERKAANKRLAKLQETIQTSERAYAGKEGKDLIFGLPKIISDDDFAKYTFQDLIMVAEGTSLENQYAKLAGGVRDIRDDIRNDRIRGKNPSRDIPYAGAVQSEASAAKKDRLMEQFVPIKAQLDELKKSAVWNSSEFKDMHAALEALLERPDAQNPDAPGQERSIPDLKEAIEKLSQQTRKYIDMKREIPKTDAGRKRLHLAHSLQELCIDAAQQLTAAGLDADKVPAPTFQAKIKQQMKEIQTAADKEIVDAISQNKKPLPDAISKLQYLNNVSYVLKCDGNIEALNMLKPDYMREQIEKMRPYSQDYLDDVPMNDLKSILNEQKISMTRFQKSYFDHVPGKRSDSMSASVHEKADVNKKSADKSMEAHEKAKSTVRKL